MILVRRTHLTAAGWFISRLCLAGTVGEVMKRNMNLIRSILLKLEKVESAGKMQQFIY